jgi:hypothetical protein
VPTVRNVTNINEVLLEKVEPRIVAQLPTRMLLLQLLERVAAKVNGGGQSYQFAIKTQDGESYRAMREAEPVPDPSAGKHERLTIPTKLMAGVFDVSALAEEVSKGRENSLIDIVKDGTTDLTNAYRRNWSRSLYGLGDGAIARVGATITPGVPGTFEVRNPSIADRWGGTYIRPGMRLSASANITAGDFIAELALDATVTDVDRSVSPAVITVDKLIAGDVADGSYLFVGGPRFTSKNRESLGLLAAYDDGGFADPYLTKARTGAGGGLWQSDVTTGVGTSNIERALMIAATRVTATADDMFTDLLTTPGAFNAYYMPFLAGRQMAPGAQGLETVGGFTKMPIMLQGKKVDFWIDPDGLYGVVFGIHRGTLKIVEVKKPGFWIGEGGKPVRSSTNLMSRYIFWGASDLAAQKPNNGCRLDGITPIPA